MNEYCKNCPNRLVPLSLKEKLNKYHSKTFVECPSSDPKVVGCLIKEKLNIDWNSFCTWLNDNNDLTVQEAIEMARAGLFKEQKGRTVIDE